jgi:hypothetical protein
MNVHLAAAHIAPDTWLWLPAYCFLCLLGAGRCHESISDTANICQVQVAVIAIKPDTSELFQMHTLINKKLALAVRTSNCSAAVTTSAMVILVSSAAFTIINHQAMH